MDNDQLVSAVAALRGAVHQAIADLAKIHAKTQDTRLPAQIALDDIAFRAEQATTVLRITLEAIG